VDFNCGLVLDSRFNEMDRGNVSFKGLLRLLRKPRSDVVVAFRRRDLRFIDIDYGNPSFDGLLRRRQCRK